jgi:hypothetical protein
MPLVTSKRHFTGLIDGPYRTAHLQAKLIGRAIGFAAPSLSEALALRLGRENEVADASYHPWSSGGGRRSTR